MKRYWFLLFVFLSVEGFAQNQDRIWVFGDSSGIDFTDISNPVPITNLSSFEDENCASICDKNGHVLFYVAGTSDSTGLVYYLLMNIYNQYGEIMENGDSIQSDYSQTNGLMIIPFPYDSEKYYLFHLKHNGYQIQLLYSVIDMEFNNGAGMVISKNNLLSSEIDDSLCEQLAAVKHANGNDWWLVYHDYLTNRIFERLITGDGISDVASQEVGGSHSLGIQGESAFSIDGTKFISVGYRVADIFNFDRCTGDFNLIASLGDSLYSPFPFYYGCAFSPSGQLVYISVMGDQLYNSNHLYQLDLSQVNILDSKVEIYSGPSDNTQAFIGQLQNAPDGRIYLAFSEGVPYSIIDYDSTSLNLSTINSPDNVGLSCDFHPFSFSLNGGIAGLGLPNLPNYNLNKTEEDGCDTTIATIIPVITNFNFTIVPNPATQYLNIIYTSNADALFELYDIFGQRVAAISLFHYFKNRLLDVSALPAGTYLGVIKENGKQVWSEKVVVAR